VVGLVAKVLALRPVVADHFWLLAAIAVVNVALGIAVYLRWGVLLLAGSEEEGAAEDAPMNAVRATHRASWPELTAVVTSGAVVVLLSVAPQLVAVLTTGL
jgi:NADH-quinone oxidoreductase subunit N